MVSRLGLLHIQIVPLLIIEHHIGAMLYDKCLILLMIHKTIYFLNHNKLNKLNLIQKDTQMSIHDSHVTVLLISFN